jgi:hypothetical protein
LTESLAASIGAGGRNLAAAAVPSHLDLLQAIMMKVWS